MMRCVLYMLSTSNEPSGVLDTLQRVPPDISYLDTLLSVILSLITLFTLLWQLWKRVIYPYTIYNRKVDLYYTKSIRKAASRCFIPTKAQDIDPCEQEEIRENNGKYLSTRLIPFFCTKAFAESSFGKYYLVLADSGMGKSTFLLNLYKSYLLKISLRKKPIELIPLAYKDCIDAICAIKDKENTILLLDALDENPSAIKDYDLFFQTLLEATEKFYKIVITCRTQFFPNSEKEPNSTGFIRVGMGRKSNEITKKYLSPFSDEEVKQYLSKYYRFDKKKREQAFAIVQKVPALMARPVILNWMDFLCDPSQEYDYTFLIYTTILDKWIEREKLSASGKKLRELSLAVAEYMFIHKTTTMPGNKVDEIASRKKIEILPIIAKSRSLLNRNSAGEYKFAHRSFLEYLTVYCVFTKKYPLETMEYVFTSSGTRRFLFEILLHSATLRKYWSSDQSNRLYDRADSALNTGKLLEIFLGSDLDLMVRHSAKGFLITCRTHMLKSEVWNPANVEKASKDMFFVGDQVHQEGVAEFKFDFFVEMDKGRYTITLALQCENESPVR